MTTNTQIENYMTTRAQIKRIENILGGDWDMRYALEKIIPPLLADGYETEDIRDYIVIKLYEAIDKLEQEKETVTINNK